MEQERGRNIKWYLCKRKGAGGGISPDPLDSFLAVCSIHNKMPLKRLGGNVQLPAVEPVYTTAFYIIVFTVKLPVCWTSGQWSPCLLVYQRSGSFIIRCAVTTQATQCKQLITINFVSHSVWIIGNFLKFEHRLSFCWRMCALTSLTLQSTP